MGETSGIAIRALSLGKPLVVSDVGWFSELPRDVAFAIPPDDDEVETLTAALELLAARPDVRAAMGETRPSSRDATTTSSASRSATSRPSSAPPVGIRSTTRCSAT